MASNVAYQPKDIDRVGKIYVVEKSKQRGDAKAKYLVKKKYKTANQCINKNYGRIKFDAQSLIFLIVIVYKPH
jgi:hypothetical protein